MKHTAKIIASPVVAGFTGCEIGDEIEVTVDFYLEDNSFDHEFGTERGPLELVIESVTCGRVELYDYLDDAEMQAIERQVKKRLAQ